MSVSADALRTHIEYTAWASQRLVQTAGELNEEELNRDFGTADGSVLGTLVHTFAADRLWLSRLSGSPHPGFITPADRYLSVLQNHWPILHQRWREWAVGLTDDKARELLSYTDMKGRLWSEPLWQLVLHVVNHGTHHRGQVAGFLRSMGHTPPATDLIYFYRASEG
ncbi:putative DinB family protein [Candidatus Sulfopaludibacter sp. SbA3]|nr:putative DinB family protein [Candidatus Sulfopaludibacter sp. SbA3]